MQLSPLLATAAPSGLPPGWAAADTPDDGAAFGAELLRASLGQDGDDTGLGLTRAANPSLPGVDAAAGAAGVGADDAATALIPGLADPTLGPLEQVTPTTIDETSTAGGLQTALAFAARFGPKAESPSSPTSPSSTGSESSADSPLLALAPGATPEKGLARALDRAAPRATERPEVGVQRALSRSAASAAETNRLARERTLQERQAPEKAARDEDLEPSADPTAAPLAEAGLPASALAQGAGTPTSASAAPTALAAWTSGPASARAAAAATAAEGGAGQRTLPLSAKGTPTARGVSSTPGRDTNSASGAPASAPASAQASTFGIAARAQAAKADTGASLPTSMPAWAASVLTGAELNRADARLSAANDVAADSPASAATAARTDAAAQDDAAARSAKGTAALGQASPWQAAHAATSAAGSTATGAAADEPVAAGAENSLRTSAQTLAARQGEGSASAAAATAVAMASASRVERQAASASQASAASAAAGRLGETAAGRSGEAAAGRPGETAAGRLSETASVAVRHASEQAFSVPVTAAAQALTPSPAAQAASISPVAPAGSPAFDTPRSAIAEAVLAARWDSPEAVPALGRQITFFAREGIEHARIQLNPQDLGPIQVQLALDGTQVRLDLAAEVASTRALLEQSLPSLASSLREGGFTLSGGGVFQEPRRGEASADGAGLGGRGQSGGNGQAGAGSAENGDSSGRSRSGTLRRSAGLVDVFA